MKDMQKIKYKRKMFSTKKRNFFIIC
jgi:hypothetical protein